MQFAQLKRREFVTLLGGLAVWPLAAHAERTTRPIVGFLNSASADKYAHLAAAFRQGLNDLGFVDGQNITIEYRWAAGQYDRPVWAYSTRCLQSFNFESLLRRAA